LFQIINLFSLSIPLLFAVDEVLKIKAFCTICGMDAGKTQRLRATQHSDRVKVGGAESYEPRCSEHWESK